jgi:hypothetical protein
MGCDIAAIFLRSGWSVRAGSARQRELGARGSPDMASRIDDPNLDVEPDDVLVLRNAGPKGAPGMADAGYLSL